MIRTENFEINGVTFVKTYSDSGRYVVRDGISYDEACDPADLDRIYVEGDTIHEESGEEELLTTIFEDSLVKFSPEDEPDYFSENEEEPNYFA